LEEAFVGRFTDHHAFLLAKMLARIDAIDADIAEVETRIEDQIAPSAAVVARLDTIPGVGVTTAQVIIAEVGLDMTRFPTAAQLASWARFSPTISESAGKKKGKNATGKGNHYLARVLGEAPVPPSRPARPTPSSANGTDGSAAGAARRRPSSPAAAPSWSSAGTCCPTRGRLRRPRLRLLRHPRRPSTGHPQPRPPPGSPRLQGHPPPRRLTPDHKPLPAPLALCRLPRTSDFRTREFGVSESGASPAACDNCCDGNLVLGGGGRVVGVDGGACWVMATGPA
jgi:hypothetical protein